MNQFFLLDAVHGDEDSDNEWLPTFSHQRKLQLVGLGQEWVSLVTMRGECDNDPEVIQEVRVEGIRCPVHQIRSVCRSRNKNIVDLVFAIDPTCVSKIAKDDHSSNNSSGWTCAIEMPEGFAPLCYVSRHSKFQYLAVLFHDFGIVVVDITPVSFTILWDIVGSCDVHMNSKKIATDVSNKLQIVNAEPDTKHDILVSSNQTHKVAEVCARTLEMNDESMLLFYKSRITKQHSNGGGGSGDVYYDLTGINPSTMKYLRTSGIMRSGDLVSVSCTNSCTNSCTDSPALASVTVSGDTVVLDKNMYVLPDFSLTSSSSSNQFVCVEDPFTQMSHILQFDKSESFVKYDHQVYTHGTSFRVGNTNVTVAKGSIILIIEDDPSIPTDFPGGQDDAEQALNAGDLVVRDLFLRSSFQVAKKVEDGETKALNSFHVYDPSTGETRECTTVEYCLNQKGDTGSLAVNVLYTDDNDLQTMVNTFTTNPSATTITTRDGTEAVTATFDANGLSFDSDNGDIYFGAAKDFRIHYAQEEGLNPAMLQIQSLVGDDYLTRLLITADNP